MQGGLGCGPQHSPKSLEHICSIMPSALCSISHCVQILDTVVRDQPLSQLPAADACHLGELCRNMLGEPWQLFCSLGSCAGVMRGAQNTLLASAPASPQEGTRYGNVFHPDADTLGHSSSEGGPSLMGVTALILTLGCLWVMSPPLPEGTATLQQQHGAKTLQMQDALCCWDGTQREERNRALWQIPQWPPPPHPMFTPGAAPMAALLSLALGQLCAGSWVPGSPRQLAVPSQSS